jgi:SAM-dependent methyltransferase
MSRVRQASIELAVSWQGPHARHRDRLFLERVNFWRDLFPADLGSRLERGEAGSPVAVTLAAGEAVPPDSDANLQLLRRAQFGAGRRLRVQPRTGRFYPRGWAAGLADVFSQDHRPMRCLGPRDDWLSLDFNHPLARFPLRIDATLVQELGPRDDNGGRCSDLAEELTLRGPGMQCALPELDTDFLADAPFAREDERPDGEFYLRPRMVDHLDETAMAQVSALYRRLLPPQCQVLDLMSSCNSHLPQAISGLEVTGLGLNREELDANPRLSHRVVRDLNADPVLPFPDASFDAAVCTVSVEYLTRPIEVFREVGRVLRPGGLFVLTFSERWFPPKVVQIWAELHPFERMGLVLDYLRRSAAFTDLHTESVRGLPRPAGDRYADRLPYSDPVYAVWGRVVTAHAARPRQTGAPA